jgi:pimeloyl-ACP methyl ester carboxylesterase
MQKLLYMTSFTLIRDEPKLFAKRTNGVQNVRYTIDKLGAEVFCLMDAAGREKAVLGGHDWGAIIAWWIAATHPNRVARMAVVNVPHGTVMLKYLR